VPYFLWVTARVLRELLEATGVAGPAVHDARIAAICRAHRVTELLSADRDLRRFPRLRVRNPLR
jgi:predicted nucleic acid-binding protein